ncbi:GNAT family N-acetyltransferase [Sphingomonas sp. 2R-10]|uniref:GNAT family N-acetyltransferase n=1 Tax=Sphingomonas sp. 2R-10 TaxID=3045148 RepID=UPI0013DDA357|nr:GNAT family N-acetyltransferase [Sphingomonas sp. 2R-10]
MDTSYQLQWATKTDYDDLADVMFEAVRSGPSKYTDRQRERWVPHRRSGEEWDARLDRQMIVLARSVTVIAGFMSLEPNGYIDFAYIRPSAQGTGLFRQLYTWIEQRSLERGDGKLWVHASLMAQPAFAAMGFSIVEHQTVEIDGESFDRAEMQKVFAIPK